MTPPRCRPTGSAAGKVIPASTGSISAGSGPRCEAAIGVPWANASQKTIGKPSKHSEGKISRRAAAITAMASGAERWPEEFDRQTLRGLF